MKRDRIRGALLLLAGGAIYVGLYALLGIGWTDGQVFAVWVGLPGILISGGVGVWLVVFGILYWTAPKPGRGGAHPRSNLIHFPKPFRPRPEGNQDGAA